MKKSIYTLGLLLLLPFVGVLAQSPYFYYYGNNKHYLEVSPDKVLIQFTENTDVNVAKNVIAKNTSLQVSDIRKTAYKGLNVISFSNADTSTTKKLIRQWQNKDSILYSGPVFIDEYGEDAAALTNQVIVRLKQVCKKNS